MHAFLLIALSTVAVPDRDDPNVKAPKPVQEQLQGEWTVERSVRAGTEAPLETIQKIKFVFEGKQIGLLEPNGRFPNRGTFTVDSKKKPITIDVDIELVSGPGAKGQKITLFGIIEIQGDQLKICYVDGALARPAEFAAPAGVDIRLFYLRRVKK